MSNIIPSHAALLWRKTLFRFLFIFVLQETSRICWEQDRCIWIGGRRIQDCQCGDRVWVQPQRPQGGERWCPRALRPLKISLRPRAAVALLYWTCPRAAKGAALCRAIFKWWIRKTSTDCGIFPWPERNWLIVATRSRLGATTASIRPPLGKNNSKLNT